jgi:hypothetical protein
MRLRHRTAGSLLGRGAIYAAAALAAAAVPVAASSAAAARSLPAPTGLQSFELFPDAAGKTSPTFSRTPSFAWNPVRGAARYQFELSTSNTFRAGNAVVWSSASLKSPAAAVPIALPWLGGRSLYWRVRAFGGDTVSPWSTTAAFKLMAAAAPHRVAGGPGYIRWSSVPGVTGYEVWFVNLGKIVSTATTAADLRDYVGEKAPDEVVWRVRAERRLFGSDKRALPAVSYSPWSDAYTTAMEVRTSMPLKTLSEGMTETESGFQHRLMPVFLFPTKDRAQLHHVYVATDAACKKVVFNSAVVRGGAFAPRSSQSLRSSLGATPVNVAPVIAVDGKRIWPSEVGTAAANGVARVDLRGGRYFWTVVPVERRADNTYHDLVRPETACRSSKGVLDRGANVPILGSGEAPFATGLSPLGRLFTSSTTPGSFYGSPLVAWRPAAGATQYEVQWSRSEDPWVTVGGLKTHATSATLPLTPGTWWYRVRGINGSIQGDARMRWSAAAPVSIAAPTFTIVEN